MRQIKFRAWDKVFNRMILPEKSDNFKINFLGCITEYDTWCTRDLILMLFTGLTDRNGVEIFEGDIIYLNRKGGVNVIDLNDINPNIRIIKWNEKDTGYGFDESGLTFFKGNCDLFEIIGNIHENPELLGEKQ